MTTINWGIIGCGDVTELKSGPAFNKVANSKLVAVMRRNADKAKSYAERHQVPKWYTDAQQLINDPAVNAIYIATPPDSHEVFTIAALAAGKSVYVEKPMTLNHASASRMVALAQQQQAKLVVAHYRRAQPLFKKIKQLVADRAIGEARFVRLNCIKKAIPAAALKEEKIAWRVNPAISGGGLFHDLAPHQLDLMYYFFGEAKSVNGLSTNQANGYAADDAVSGNILFENGVLFSGSWNFALPQVEEIDTCEIIGTKGKITFSIFEGHSITVIIDGETSTFSFDPIQHVQQPMIEQVVNYFLGQAENPCPAAEGAVIMEWMDAMTQKH